MDLYILRTANVDYKLKIYNIMSAKEQRKPDNYADGDCGPKIADL